MEDFMWANIASLIIGAGLMVPEIIVEAPKTITKEWEATFLGYKYDLPTVDQAVEEMIFDLDKKLFDQAFLDRIKSAIEKEPSGVYIEYWPNGQIKVKLPYENKKPHGHLHAWYENGCNAFKGHFSHGTKQGVHISFYPAEFHFQQNFASRQEFNEQGLLEGSIAKYAQFGHRNSLILLTTYRNGILTGSLSAWEASKKEYIPMWKGEYLSAWYVDGQLKNDTPKNLRKKEALDSIYVKYTDDISKEFLEEVQTIYKLYPFCCSGSMPFDVVTIGIALESSKRMNKAQARKLFVMLKEKLAAMVNSHEKIRPYLREYPFPSESADITLLFKKKNFEHYKDGSITKVLLSRDNQIIYYYYDPNNPDERIELEEPYAEAVKIVHGTP